MDLMYILLFSILGVTVVLLTLFTIVGMQTKKPTPNVHQPILQSPQPTVVPTGPLLSDSSTSPESTTISSSPNKATVSSNSSSSPSISSSSSPTSTTPLSTSSSSSSSLGSSSSSIFDSSSKTSHSKSPLKSQLKEEEGEEEERKKSDNSVITISDKDGFPRHITSEFVFKSNTPIKEAEPEE